MGIFSKLFGGKQKKSGQSDPEIRRLADEASRVADEMIDRKYVGGRLNWGSTFKSGSESPLTKAVDRVLELAPENPDFLFAKSEAHYALADGETGQEYRKRTLAIAPDHFDANMAQNHHRHWSNLFGEFAGWNERSKTLPGVMLEPQSAGTAVHIVRDGLILTLAIVIQQSAEQFPASEVDSRWKPLWVNTPHGPTFAHYVLLKHQTDLFDKREYFLSAYPIEPVRTRQGNWLIRRFCEVESFFIVVNDNTDVIYNKRYTFSKSLRSTLKDIKSKLGEVTPSHDWQQKYQLAMQWYEQNSNLDDIVW